jgi:tRNA(Ile)-lysidine synthase
MAMKKVRKKDKKYILAISGGPDSVFLVNRLRGNYPFLILGHINHGARGMESEEDQRFVERLGRDIGVPVVTRRMKGKPSFAGFEQEARRARYSFLKKLKKKHGAEKILLAHTADDQVETILMRVFEGAGLAGLKGIPRETRDGVARPLLDTWRNEILEYLQAKKIPYRTDSSNFDTRFERNWIRHVLIPMLEKRYGKSLKSRIFSLGERFREIDDYVERTSRRWLMRNATAGDGNAHVRFPRKRYEKLPAAARKKLLQLLSFEHAGISPNERLLESMDKLIVGKKASGRLNIGKKRILRCRYDQAILETENSVTDQGKRSILSMSGPGRYGIGKGKGGGTVPAGLPKELLFEERGRISSAGLKRLAKKERTAVFDGDEVHLPLTLRRLRKGDRIRPFGLDAEKKIKEILIDRKVPREERWGRPVVCDAKGRILWIPGVLRSSLAPVTESTCRSVVLRAIFPAAPGR